MKRFVLFSVLLSALLPASAFAGVKIGAGNIDLPPSNLPRATSPEQTLDEKPEPSLQDIQYAERQQVKASALARSVAELFRKDVTDLKSSLIEKALVNVPSNQRESYRRNLGREIKVDRVLNLYAVTLDQYYTEDELKSLRTFMADDTHRAMLEKLPTVMNRMGMDRQSYLNQVLQDFLNKEFYQKLEKGDPTILTPR
ncbi:MAG: hypothetical protein CMF62_09465 [Magnetococcales bacterium]|nr:hypothetical protein [Magnetococcales bacterium]|tara:strand:- start:395055 stop:395648 length:594 start_codon:yes stop_codon:yes gene_type:complete